MNAEVKTRPRALITGAGRRLGAFLAHDLTQKGWTVALHAHKPLDTTSELEVYYADLGLPEQAEDLMDRILAQGPLDLLVNAASIYPQDSWETADLTAIHSSDALHALAPLILARRWFKEPHSQGQIINILDARFKDNDAQHFSYQLGKRRLADLTALLAWQMAPRFRVNAIAPGLVLPPADFDPILWQSWASSSPLNRTGTPQDVALALNYLAQSDYVTGQILYVDGGRHLRGDFFGG